MFDLIEGLSNQEKLFLEMSNRDLAHLAEQRVPWIHGACSIDIQNPDNLRFLFDHYRYSSLERFLDVADSMSLLWNAGRFITCMMLERTFLESVAAQHLFVSEFEKHIKSKNYDKAYLWVASNVFALKSDLFLSEDVKRIKFKNIHINDAVRKISKKYSGFRKIYDSLSDVVHPNFLGVAGAYTVSSSDQARIMFSNIRSHKDTYTTSTLFFSVAYREDWEKGAKLSNEIVNSDWKASENIDELFKDQRYG